MVRHRGGFGLFEALVLLAVLAILATVLATNNVALDAARRLQQSHLDLERIADAVRAFEQDDMRCPARFDQLLDPLQPGDTALSGEKFTGGERRRWRGPYYHLLAPSIGPLTGMGRVTGFRLISLDPKIPALIIDSDIYDAAALDGKHDAGDGGSLGAIRWVPISGDRVEVEYRLLDVVCAPGESA